MPALFDAADYQPGLQARFVALRELLLARWPDARVEHIGASSLAGAVSKGDLDVLFLVAADELETIRAQLIALGYVEKLGTLRTTALCMLEAADHALQLVAAGSAHEAVFLGFRDRLRADASLVAEYNAIKRRHAADSDDDYRAAKAAFIEGLLGA